MNPPDLRAFSKEAINKAVTSKALTNPLVVYPTTLGTIGIASLFILHLPASVLLLGVGGITVGIGSAVFNLFFRNETLAREYTDDIRKQMEEYRVQQVKDLRTKLAKYSKVEGADQHCVQAIQQFDMIDSKLEKLGQILSTKLNTSSLSFHRFLGSGTQVCQKMLDTIKDMISVLDSVAGIDMDYIEQRQVALERLKKTKKFGLADQQELGTLEERIKLRNEQLEQVNVLLTRNEEAITKFDKLVAEVTKMFLNSSVDQNNIEQCITRMQEITK